MDNPAELILQIKASLHQLTVTSEAFLVITTLVIGLRVWARAGILRSMSSDDWVIIAAWGSYCVVCGLTLGLTTAMGGVFNGKPPDYKYLELIAKFATAMYVVSMALIKISLGLLFLRLFAAAHPIHRWVIYAVMTITTALSLVYFIMSVGTCGLTHGFLPTSAQCSIWQSYARLSIGWSVINAITDFIFSAMSVDALWKVKLPRKTKFIASLVLLIGAAGGIASIVRVSILARASDLSYVSGLQSGFWTLVEAGIGITAVSLACLRPLLRVIKSLTKRSGTTNDDTAYDRNITMGTYGPATPNMAGHDRWSKEMNRLSTALSSSYPQKGAVRDWRDDRIGSDLELCSPNAAIISSTLSWESKRPSHGSQYIG